MTRRLQDEQGSAMLAALALIFAMALLGAAAIALGDTQERQSGQERTREVSLGITEAALEAQVVRLSGPWPMSLATAFPSACQPGSGAISQCPDGNALNATFDNAESNATCGGAPAWRTTVRDNGGGATNYYRTSIVNLQPAFDANGDGMLWVRSEGRTGCKLRTVVVLVRANVVTLPFPRVTIGANWFWTNNQGRKVIVDTLGQYAQPPSVRPDRATAQPAPVQARCVAPTPSPCVKTDAGKGQVSGSTPQANSSLQSPALSDSYLTLLKAYARLKSSYYPVGSCPPNLTGELVYIEDATGCPAYAGGNSKASPGMVVFGKGGLTLGGNQMFYGVVYARNETNLTSAMVTIQGTAAIQGSILVDGLGGVLAGASATNVVFDPRVTSLVKGLGDATQVLGTWREITGAE